MSVAWEQRFNLSTEKPKNEKIIQKMYKVILT